MLPNHIQFSMCKNKINVHTIMLLHNRYWSIIYLNSFFSSQYLIFFTLINSEKMHNQSILYIVYFTPRQLTGAKTLSRLLIFQRIKYAYFSQRIKTGKKTVYHAFKIGLVLSGLSKSNFNLKEK